MHRRAAFVAALVTVVAVATLPLASLAGASEAARAGPPSDAFYLPPQPLPPAAAGTPIRTQALRAPAGARAWLILYHSRAVDGSDIAVSGLLVAPTGPAPRGGRPIVTWAHGTTGLADACAPSKQVGAVSGLPALRALLRAGDVVVATDYEGLGTPGVHPYLVGDSEGRSVLDAARAARAVPGTGAGRDVVVLGHSQGGHAALFAGEIAARYAPELRIRGVVSAAPVADLTALLPAARSSNNAVGFVVLGVFGFHAAYPEADPAAVLTPAALAKSGLVADACSLTVLLSYASPVASVIAHNPADLQPWADLVKVNSAGNEVIPAPTLILQGGRDTLIVKSFTDAFVRKECAVGTKVDYRVYPRADHGSVFGAAQHDVLAFFDAVLHHRAVPETCPARRRTSG